MKATSALLTLLLLTFNGYSQVQGPEITSWIINPGGATGYNGIASNVQSIEYSTSYVYVKASCIPGYDIGPWTANPNLPANQDFTFKFNRFPSENTGSKTATPLGHIGTWTNGVSIFNAMDGFSYNDLGFWNQDAIPNEGLSFDNCLGHPAGNGEYHHHLNPTCLYDDTDSLNHSPIIGYAFDGFPIYGAYAFEYSNGFGNIKRMLPSYQLRNISFRTSKPDGTVLASNEYGPTVDVSYPLGSFIEDYEYLAASGHLDEYNGRFCITPEYPAGTYAYFVTIDENQDGVYPYVIGPNYYGNVMAGNTGPASGHIVISEAVTVITTIEEASGKNETLTVFPNPARESFSIDFSKVAGIPESLQIHNDLGMPLYTINLKENPQTVFHPGLSSGLYQIHLKTSLKIYSSTIIIQ